MIDKDDVRGVANWSVVAGEVKTAGRTVHWKDCNVVGSLIQQSRMISDPDQTAIRRSG